MKVYISGRISGLDKEEYTATFAKAESLLKAEGYIVVNPTRTYLCRWNWLYRFVGYRLTLLYDLWLLMHCDRIYKMPNWKESRGANIESCVAYHFNIWTIANWQREKIDRLL